MDKPRPDVDELRDESDHAETHVLDEDELAELEECGLTAIVKQLSEQDRRS